MEQRLLLILLEVALIALSGISITVWKQTSAQKVQLLGDKSTLQWFRALVLTAFVVSGASYWADFTPLRLPQWAQGFSFGLVIAGLALRWAAVLQLGRAFTTQVAITRGHILHTEGVFRYIRHPSYTGLLLYDLGLGIALSDGLAIIALTTLPYWAIHQRIRVEEALLSSHFGAAYDKYRRQTGKLLPKLKTFF
jgi:protein-S-isoprenylcysteine O-methyltransferase